MTTKYFEEISFAGRMAFGINCLEMAILHLDQNIADWKSVIADWWAYSSIRNLDVWSELIAEIQPRCILGEMGFDDDFEHIDEPKFLYLKQLYSALPIELNTIMKYLFDLATCHMYSSILNRGPESLQILDSLVGFMNNEQLPLPNADKYKFFPFSENRGWGKSFNEKEYSVLLEST